VSGLLLQRLRGGATSRRPVWLMRQAGRYLPEYRALRARHSFEDMSRDSTLAAEVTLQPLVRFPLDAAIIFADLMSPVGALGVKVRFDPGPVIEHPIRTPADVDALRLPLSEEIAPEVMGALRLVKRELNDRATLVGFVGAPWSIAAYLVQGRSVSGFPALRALAVEDRGLVWALLTRLTDLVIAYAGEQIAAGAEVIQVFDTWPGMLSRAEWVSLVQPHLERIVHAIRAFGSPSILFVHDAPHLVQEYAALRPDAISVDWREDIAQLTTDLAPHTIVQGNLDPATLLAGPDATRRATADLLSRVQPRTHIVNLGHGLLPETPLESVQALIDVVHAEGTQ
jgi:uroporphyrinogen decarboxylase